MLGEYTLYICLQTTPNMPPPVYNMFSCLLSIIIYTKLFRTHLSADLPKELLYERLRTANIIILYMRAICHRVQIYIYIANHPNRSHAVEKR